MDAENTMPLCICDLNVAGSKDTFLTHAPMSSCMGGFRPKTVITLDPESWKSKTTMADSPFVFPRSASAYGEHPSLRLTTRAKSAHFTTTTSSTAFSSIVMPRSGHMSVAGFCDWSSEGQGDCYSVSRLYREIANHPQSQSRCSGNTGKAKFTINLNLASGCGTGAHGVLANNNIVNRSSFNSPGRMFVRDKKALTSGEREIIEGIYKNRSDLNSKDAIANLNYKVRSHQEAWQTGKLIFKNEKIDVKPLIKSNMLHENHHKKPQHDQHKQHCKHNTTSSITNKNDRIPSTARLASTETTSSITNKKDRIPSTGRLASTENYSNKMYIPVSLSSRLGNKSPTVMETSPFPKCSQCLLEERERSNQDLTKRVYSAHQQNPENNWDSRSRAPPSIPDRVTGIVGHFGQSSAHQQNPENNWDSRSRAPPSIPDRVTGIVGHFGQSSAHQQNPENNWDFRPRAPPSIPDRVSGIAGHLGPSSSFKPINSNPHPNSLAHVTVIDSSRFGSSSENYTSRRYTDRSPLFQSKEGNNTYDNMTHGSADNIEKTINIIHSILEENSKSISGKQNSESSGFHSEGLQNLEIEMRHLESCGSDRSVSESKKVKVKVYLPLADNDEHRDITSDYGAETSSVAGSLSKDSFTKITEDVELK